MPRTHKALIVIGLIVGAVLGMAGTFVASDQLRAVLWTIDGVALVIATTLLAFHYFRAQRDLLAAGFLIYAIGESVMMVGNSAGIPGCVPSFAAGTALWAAGLMLTAVPAGLAVWTRLAAFVASILFAATSLRIMSGMPLTPLARPLPFFAYPVLVLTFIGWIFATLREA